MSKIEWCDVTWNCLRGCSRVSDGCTNCYAERVAWRFSGPGRPYEGLVKRVNGHTTWNGKIKLLPEKLTEPLHWKKPRRVFVNSMSDLFHENVPFEFIDRVFAMMALCPQHTFQVLTKRPERMREYVLSCSVRLGRQAEIRRELERFGLGEDEIRRAKLRVSGAGAGWEPLPNVHLGVSVEDQAAADERIPLLLDTPAAVRWVSYEPALAVVDFSKWMWPLCWSWDGKYRSPSNAVFINWLVCGGESGPGARPCDVAWIRSTVQQCKAAGVPCFVKQLGAHVVDRNDAGFDGDGRWEWPEATLIGESERYQGAPCQILLCNRKGGDMAEWPEGLRVREYPE